MPPLVFRCIKLSVFHEFSIFTFNFTRLNVAFLRSSYDNSYFIFSQVGFCLWRRNFIKRSEMIPRTLRNFNFCASISHYFWCMYSIGLIVLLFNGSRFRYFSRMSQKYFEHSKGNDQYNFVFTLWEEDSLLAILNAIRR